jgi:ABC-type sugar transport system substrate-binding protein
MAGAPDAICIVGNPHDAQLMPLIESAIEGGIVVTTYHREMRPTQERFSADGFGFAGPDHYSAGQGLITAAVKKHRLAPGAVILLLHDPAQRDDDGLFGGAMSALQAHGLVVELVKISRGEPDAVESALKTSLEATIAKDAEPALVCSLYASLDACVRALNASGIDSNSLPLVGIRVGNDIRGIDEAGKTHLSLVLEQDLPLQVYLTILQSCLSKQYSAVGSRILTPFTIVDCDLPPPEDSRHAVENFIQRF